MIERFQTTETADTVSVRCDGGNEAMLHMLDWHSPSFPVDMDDLDWFTLNGNDPEEYYQP